MDFLRSRAERLVGLVHFPYDATMVDVGDAIFLRRVAGDQGQPHVTSKGGSHVVQEDKPAELVRVVLGS
jgi:hypothetical protein